MSIVLHNERPDPARLEAAVEGALAQMWPAVEVILADESESSECREVVAAYDGRVSSLPDGEESEAPAVERAIEMSRGEFIAFADCETPLRPTAVQVGLAYPAFSQFSGWRAPAEYEQLERTLRLAQEIASVVPPEQTYALADGRLKLPGFADSRQWLPFLAQDGEQVTRPPDAVAAIEIVEELRRAGTGFVAFAWPAFRWFNEYGELRDHLSSTAHRVLESERVVVFDLR